MSNLLRSLRSLLNLDRRTVLTNVFFNVPNNNFIYLGIIQLLLVFAR